VKPLEDKSSEESWATLYQAVTHHGDVMERMYACLGRMITIKQQAPDNLAMLAECENTMSFLLEQSHVAKSAMEEARARYDESVRNGGTMPVMLSEKYPNTRN
jgi:hypothetical protein